MLLSHKNSKSNLRHSFFILFFLMLFIGGTSYATTPSPKPLHHWKFNEMQGKTLKDHSGTADLDLQGTISPNSRLLKRVKSFFALEWKANPTETIVNFLLIS